MGKVKEMREQEEMKDHCLLTSENSGMKAE